MSQRPGFARLGFGEIFRDHPADPRYAGVRRDDVELHLQWADESQWAGSVDRPSYRFVVSDVDRLFAQLREACPDLLAPAGRSPWAAPGDTPWGSREFHLLDPDGNGLQFYRALGS
ncbi:MAG: glyoxalase/bleomycin resistance/extradiol dioxygenase family protein [Thermoanaerobaculia bacterium]